MGLAGFSRRLCYVSEFRVSGDVAQGDLGAGAHLAPDVALNILKKKEN